MKLTTLLLIICCMHVSANAVSQNISLTMRNATVREVLSAIEKQTGYYFFWRGTALNDTKISIDLKDIPFEDAITKVLGDLPYSFSITKKSVVISPETRTRSERGRSAVAATSWFQERISGVIRDAQGNALAGVTVSVKGQPISTQSDDNGRFVLSGVAQGTTLEFSSLGYVSQERTINDASPLTVVLQDGQSELDEVVVVAYGTANRLTYTGSIAQIGSEAIEKRPVTNAMSALVGVAPGIQSTVAGGAPGEDPSFRLRGFGSVSASNTALIVMDGVPFDGAMANINPDDIESISVLKDASTTALYGSRGANGVIMITTKSGKAGTSTLSVKATAGVINRGLPEYDRVDAMAYYPLMWEAHRNAILAGEDGVPVDIANQLASGLIGEYNGENYSGIADLLGVNPFNVPDNAIVGIDGQLNSSARLLYPDDLNWEKQATQGGKKRQNYLLSYGGGSDKTDYFGSVSYTDEQGYLIKSNLKRFTGRLNVNTQPMEWFKTGLNISGSYSWGNYDNVSGSNTSYINPFYISRFIGPIYPVHRHDPQTGDYLLDEFGQRIYDTGDGRPFASGRHTIYENLLDDQLRNRGFLGGRAYAEISILPQLTARTNISFDLQDTHQRLYDNPIVGDGAPAGRGYNYFYRTTSYTFNQLLEYDNSFGLHNLNILAGHENYQYLYNNFNGSKSGLIIDGITELANFATITGLNSYEDRHTIESYLSRVNYDFDQRYVLSGSLRYDGNSKFHPDFRWETFWSIGGAWNIQREAFFAANWVDQLKIRASYGTVGNDGGLGYYPYQALYNLGRNNASEPGFVQGSLPNDSLTWETSKSFDVGIDFALWQNRLSGSVEYFDRQTSGLIFAVPQQMANGGTFAGSSSGFFEIDKNIGNMYNRGIEIQLNGDIVRGQDFAYSATFNFTSLTNQITKMPTGQPLIQSGTKGYSVGHSMYDFYMRRYYGVDPDNGDALYYTNELTDNAWTVGADTVTNVLSEANYRYLGESAVPDFYGSMIHNFRYKDFSLGVQFTYQIGGKFYDGAYASLMHAGTYGNAMHADIVKRWQQPGDITDVPRLDNSNTTDLSGTSSRFLTDASYLQLNSVVLSYDIPKHWLARINANTASIFVSGENLALWSARKGLNVTGSFNGTVENTYNFSKIFSMGVNIGF